MRFPLNEKIKELAEQAELEYDFNPMLWLKLEKFAELIVKECTNIVEDAVLHREPASTYVGKIKEHFGVKE